MDPQAAWLAMIQALVDEDHELASEYADALIDWLNRSGFPPKVLPELGQANDPLSSAYSLNHMIAHYVCSKVRTGGLS